MRSIIGVNGDCLWLCGDVCHPPPSLPAPRSHGKLRRRLTGTGVGSNFRFVSDLELKPAFKEHKYHAPSISVLPLLEMGTAVTETCAHLKTACQKLFPLTRSVFLRPHRAGHHLRSWRRVHSRKSSEHFASNVRASSAGPAKLDIIRGHQSVPHTRAGEAAARLEKCGQSMSTSA